MNKYELRAQAVLKKKEEYLKKREARFHKAVTVVAFAACISVVIGAAAAVKNHVRPVDSGILSEPTESYYWLTETLAASPAKTYNGKAVFVAREEENYSGYMTCYINPSDEENPHNEKNSYGVMSTQGEIVVPPVYSNAYAAGENCFVVEKRNEKDETLSALTDLNGTIIFDYFRGSIRPVTYGEDVYVLIAEGFEGKDVLIKTDGTPAINIEFENLTYAHTAGAPRGYEADELILGAYNNEIYVINYKGEITGVYGNEPEIRKALGDGFNLTAAYRNYQGNYKTLLFGVSDKNGKEIIPCEYISLYFTGERFICRRGDELSLNPDDVVVICDTDGYVVCESGIYHSVSIEYGAETGIGVRLGEWDDENSFSVGGCWIIDKNGNKLSDEYDRIDKNADGTYTAYYNKHSKIHHLDENGKIIG